MNSDILLQGLAVVIGAGGLIIGALKSQQYRAVATVVQEFAETAQAYYVAKSDGTFSAEDRAAIGQAAISFFDSVELAGVEIARPK